MRRLLPKEVELFKSGKMNTGAFLKDHIKSMLFILFQTHPPKSGPGSRKVEWLKMLLNATQKDPSKVDSYTPTAADSVSVELFVPRPHLPSCHRRPPPLIILTGISASHLFCACIFLLLLPLIPDVLSLVHEECLLTTTVQMSIHLILLMEGINETGNLLQRLRGSVSL